MRFSLTGADVVVKLAEDPNGLPPKVANQHKIVNLVCNPLLTMHSSLLLHLTNVM